jgi:peptidoglycan/LPS O-acetylase OafA/YrhL
VGTVRFLLALCVAIGHFPPQRLFGVGLMSGITAVQAFYIISGFLITFILNEDRSYRSVRSFYVSRYLRLWPTYAVIAVISLAVQPDHPLRTGVTSMGAIALAWVVLADLTLYSGDWLMFVERAGSALRFTEHFGTGPRPWMNEYLLVPQCWTLGVELTFYLLAPFVCRRVTGIAALLLFGVAVRVCLGFALPQDTDPWVYRFSPAEMMLFAAGGASYFAGREVCSRVPRLVVILLGLTCVAAATLVTLGNDYINPRIEEYFGQTYSPMLYLQDPFTLLGFVIACPFLFYGTKHMAIDRFMGELSYPIYVSHLLVGFIISRYAPVLMVSDNMPYLLAVIVVSAALYLFVGAPFDRFRRRYVTMRSGFDGQLTAAPALAS